MKILQIITSLHTGGAEKLIVDMVPMYRERGYDVDVLLLNGEETPFRRELENKQIKIYDLGKGSVYNPLKLLKMLPYLRQYDIVHTHNTAAQLFAAIGSVLCSVVLVTTEHNTSNRRRAWKWYVPIDRWMYRRYSTVICISDKAKENLTAYLGKKDAGNIVTIYNGVDCTKYHNALPHPELHGKDKVVITMVAGFRYQKDQDTLIRAMVHLPENYELWLIGDGERRTALEYLAKQERISQRVCFWGIRDDIPEMLKTSDIIVMSSHFEGLSLSSIEGMSAGKPFIASNVDGLREITDGAGLLFPHKDDKTLAQTILHLATDKEYYNTVAQRCMERASQYNISKTVNAYLDIYKSLKNKSRFKNC